MLVRGIAGGAWLLGMTGGQSTRATTESELPTADTAIVFWRLTHGFCVAAEIALAVFLGALSILARRRLVLPRWLGWVGVVVTVLLLVPADRVGRTAVPAAGVARRCECDRVASFGRLSMRYARRLRLNVSHDREADDPAPARGAVQSADLVAA